MRMWELIDTINFENCYNYNLLKLMWRTKLICTEMFSIFHGTCRRLPSLWHGKFICDKMSFTLTLRWPNFTSNVDLGVIKLRSVGSHNCSPIWFPPSALGRTAFAQKKKPFVRNSHYLENMSAFCTFKCFTPTQLLDWHTLSGQVFFCHYMLLKLLLVVETVL